MNSNVSGIHHDASSAMGSTEWIKDHLARMDDAGRVRTGVDPDETPPD